MIPANEIADAPAASKPVLEGIQKQMGFIPNFFKVLSHSPETLKAYTSLSALADQTSLSEEEKQVIYMTISYESECEYCMAAHTMLAKMGKINSNLVETLRSGFDIEDPKLNALQNFTRAIYYDRGNIYTSDVEDFLHAGYTRQNILEVILLMSIKNISNLTNHIAKTELDASFQPAAWTKDKYENEGGCCHSCSCC